jgi:hypothetical protein
MSNKDIPGGISSRTDNPSSAQRDLAITLLIYISESNMRSLLSEFALLSILIQRWAVS